MPLGPDSPPDPRRQGPRVELLANYPTQRAQGKAPGVCGQSIGVCVCVCVSVCVCVCVLAMQLRPTLCYPMD